MANQNNSDLAKNHFFSNLVSYFKILIGMYGMIWLTAICWIIVQDIPLTNLFPLVRITGFSILAGFLWDVFDQLRKLRLAKELINTMYFKTEEAYIAVFVYKLYLFVSDMKKEGKWDKLSLKTWLEWRIKHMPR